MSFTREERRAIIKAPRLHISPRNSKLGNIPSFSSLPTDTPITLKNGEPATFLSGTCHNCKECKGKCYAVRTVKMYPQVARAYSENTVLQKHNPARLKKLLNDWLTVSEPRYFRFFVSGDFYAAADTAVLLNTARRHEGTRFYAYTKNTRLIEDYAARHGMPSNVTILASVWGNTPIYGNYPQFIYDDLRNDDLRNVWHCPAVSPTGHKTGVKCLQCKACMRAKAGDKIAVYAH